MGRPGPDAGRMLRKHSVDGALEQIVSGISPVVFVVGPVRDKHRRGVESHAAVLERSLWTSDLEGQGKQTDLRILANGQKSFAVGIAVLDILDLISKSE
jgi:hypothetical protein